MAELDEALRVATEVDNLEDMLRTYANLGLCWSMPGICAFVEKLQEGLEKARSFGVLSTRRVGYWPTTRACRCSIWSLG